MVVNQLKKGGPYSLTNTIPKHDSWTILSNLTSPLALCLIGYTFYVRTNGLYYRKNDSYVHLRNPLLFP